MTTERLPRRFGPYTLTAALGSDALGDVYRAIRESGDQPFVLLRVLESPELSVEPVLDAIQENGEIHEFLKHAAVARGVDMDAIEGSPYLAWSQPNGRTVDVLSAQCRRLGRKVPVEHALLIAEKVATALDHAYNTTIDGDRTLHGLVWPGFVALSDDGEIRLAGFGLAPGILPSLRQPGLSTQLAPYVAPEERASGAPAKNSDVYSVGVLLLELLTGQPPPSDPLAFVKGVAGTPPPPVLPEVLAVLRMALAGAETRYRSSGDLRRELGKLLFSGPYSPSTFNLAYFLQELFRAEIEVETRARLSESGRPEESAPPASASAAQTPAFPERPATARPPVLPGAVETPSLTVAEPARRGPLAIVGALIAAAAVAGGIYVVARKPASVAAPPAIVDTKPTPTLLPELAATPAGPTTAMSEGQFRDEVARRLAVEVQKLETQSRVRAAEAARPLPASREPDDSVTAAVAPEPEPTEAPAAPAPAEPTAIARVEPTPAPTAPPAARRPATREGALVALDDVDTPPRIARVVKPVYPPIALQARVGGIVILRVLVSETGAPADIQVAREGRLGLTEAAVRAVRAWTFEPARKDGVAVKTWMSVPIPFEP